MPAVLPQISFSFISCKSLIQERLKNLLPSITKRKSPKRYLRALKKSYCEQPGAHPIYLLPTSSSGCLQDWRNVHSAIDQNSLPMVWVDILYLSVLFQGTSLLQRSMPVGRETKESLRGAETVPPDRQREKSPPQSRKSPQTWPEQKKSKKHG